MEPDFLDTDRTEPQSVCGVFPATAWASAMRCTVFARLAQESLQGKTSQFIALAFPHQPGKDGGQRQPMQWREKLRRCSSASKKFGHAPLLLNCPRAVLGRGQAATLWSGRRAYFFTGGMRPAVEGGTMPFKRI